MVRPTKAFCPRHNRVIPERIIRVALRGTHRKSPLKPRGKKADAGTDQIFINCPHCGETHPYQDTIDAARKAKTRL